MATVGEVVLVIVATVVVVVVLVLVAVVTAAAVVVVMATFVLVGRVAVRVSWSISTVTMTTRQMYAFCHQTIIIVGFVSRGG